MDLLFIILFKMSNITNKFSIGEIVWSKIQGYPWWPGIIKKFQIIKQKNTVDYTVSYFAQYNMQKIEQLRSILNEKKLANYVDFYNQYNQPKQFSKECKKSIRLANKFLTQKTKRHLRNQNITQLCLLFQQIQHTGIQSSQKKKIAPSQQIKNPKQTIRTSEQKIRTPQQTILSPLQKIVPSEQINISPNLQIFRSPQKIKIPQQSRSFQQSIRSPYLQTIPYQQTIRSSNYQAIRLPYQQNISNYAPMVNSYDIYNNKPIQQLRQSNQIRENYQKNNNNQSFQENNKRMIAENIQGQVVEVFNTQIQNESSEKKKIRKTKKIKKHKIIKTTAEQYNKIIITRLFYYVYPKINNSNFAYHICEQINNQFPSISNYQKLIERYNATVKFIQNSTIQQIIQKYDKKQSKNAQIVYQ